MVGVARRRAGSRARARTAHAAQLVAQPVEGGDVPDATASPARPSSAHLGRDAADDAAHRARRRPAVAQSGASPGQVFEEAAVARAARRGAAPPRSPSSARRPRGRPARPRGAHASASRNRVAKLSVASTTTSAPRDELRARSSGSARPRRLDAEVRARSARSSSALGDASSLRRPTSRVVEEDLPVQVLDARRVSSSHDDERADARLGGARCAAGAPMPPRRPDQRGRDALGRAVRRSTRRG